MIMPPLIRVRPHKSVELRTAFMSMLKAPLLNLLDHPRRTESPQILFGVFKNDPLIACHVEPVALLRQSLMRKAINGATVRARHE